VSAADAPTEPLRNLLRRHGLDSVRGAFAFTGGLDMAKAGLRRRRRTRVELTDEDGRTHVLFLKRYGRDSLAARLRRLLTHGRWCSPAAVEFRNIRSARRAGLPTMRELACGEGACGGWWRSHLVMTAVPGEAMERCPEDFWKRLYADEGAARRFATALAELVRRLHRAGFVHRDLYSSHVFLDEQDGEFRLCLIDMARVFRPRWRKFRWRVKDLAELHHSMPAQWLRRWWDELLREYLFGAEQRMNRWRRAVERKSASIARRAKRKLWARRTARSAENGSP